MPRKLLPVNGDVDFGDGAITFAIEEDDSGPDIAADYLTPEADAMTVLLSLGRDLPDYAFLIMHDALIYWALPDYAQG